jgi:hypothetical protein
MSNPTTDYRAMLRRPDGVDRLLDAGVPFCQIEEMLDELDIEAARSVAAMSESFGLSMLLWS